MKNKMLEEYSSRLASEKKKSEEEVETAKRKDEELGVKIFAVDLILKIIQKAYNYHNLAPDFIYATHVPLVEDFDVKLGWDYEEYIYTKFCSELAEMRKKAAVTGAICSVLGIGFESVEKDYLSGDEGPADVGTRFKMKFNVPTEKLSNLEKINTELIDETFTKVYAADSKK